MGAGFGGATSKNIVANRATDPFIIDFTAEDVTAVGMDITAYFNGDPPCSDRHFWSQWPVRHHYGGWHPGIGQLLGGKLR